LRLFLVKEEGRSGRCPSCSQSDIGNWKGLARRSQLDRQLMSAGLTFYYPTRYIHNQATATQADPLTFLLPLSMNSDLITEIKPSKSAPLLGFWYPACLSTELAPGGLKGTVLLGLPILVCKTSQGAVAAMRDICPHRG